ncbi:hypothetical protein [Desulforhopalus sp. 52FAK]
MQTLGLACIWIPCHLVVEGKGKYITMDIDKIADLIMKGKSGRLMNRRVPQGFSHCIDLSC